MTSTNTPTRRDPFAATWAPLLRKVLLLDGLASGTLGVAHLALAGVLDSALGMPAWFLLTIGAVLVIWAAVVSWVGTRALIRRPGIWAVIGLNVVWAVDSVVLLAAGWFDVTVLGEVFVLAQAVAVLGFAALQYVGLRRVA